MYLIIVTPSVSIRFAIFLAKIPFFRNNKIRFLSRNLEYTSWRPDCQMFQLIKDSQYQWHCAKSRAGKVIWRKSIEESFYWMFNSPGSNRGPGAGSLIFRHRDWRWIIFLFSIVLLNLLTFVMYIHICITMLLQCIICILYNLYIHSIVYY